MKNSYLNDVLNFRVELDVIKKQKYILKKPQKRRKMRRKNSKKFPHKYLLIMSRGKKLDF
jgi:hypothetical protein